MACLAAYVPNPGAAADDAEKTETGVDTLLGRAATSPTTPTRLQAIYIVAPDPFAEVEEFVEASAKHYHLDLKRYALPMRPALEAYLKDRPAIKAIFLGTRRTDPHGEFLTHFDPTDEGWPQFMRVHPVIDWHYVEIWAVSHLISPDPFWHI